MKSKLVRNLVLNQDVIIAISKGFNIPSWKVAENISTRNRQRDVVEIRHLYCYIRVVYDNISLKKTGLEVGGYDHSTVLNAKTNIQDQIDINSFAGRRYYQSCLFYTKGLNRNYKTNAINDSVKVFENLKRLLDVEQLSSQRTKIRIQVEKLKDIITLLSNQNEQENTARDCA